MRAWCRRLWSNPSQKYLKFMNYLKSTKDSIYPEIFLASLFCRASRDLLEYSSPEMLDSLSQTFGEEDSKNCPLGRGLALPPDGESGR